MKRKHFLKLMAVAAGGLVLAGCGGGDEVAEDPPSGPTAAAASLDDELSAEEIAGLMYMREEEKLAHDVYVALFNIWGAQVFANIAESEAEHTEAVRRLIEVHGLDDPAASNPPGVFENNDLQAMYDKLVARGLISLNDALAVGCLIEEKDIQDINDKKAEVQDEPDIVQVYDHLLCGSRNHLRAFNSNLLNQGVTYLPQVLTQAEWDAIAQPAAETCGA
ncbi:MAG: DUF2202 domain-containing protein [Hydrogenophaga sp.]|nr:DUF2202 domain-containing protein [Hydrogenophaga sp.]